MKTQIRLEEASARHWRAIFDHPPINLIDPETIHELSTLVTRLETDPEVCVVVFESADPEFFLAHYDVLVPKAASASMLPGPTGLPLWLDVQVRLSRAPVISIAAIRGCARGAGSEFALSCDIRFASRERARLGQFEVGVGAVPGGGPMARLSRLVGRGRALEILAGGDDFDGGLAEQYGYVNRAIPDAQFVEFVDGFARRLASFDKRALAKIKSLVDIPTLPPNDELPPGLTAFFESVNRPETREQTARLLAAGLQHRSETELLLGKHVADR
jgi:enoyl-CoA hydratase/carnithine racemase